MPALDSEEGEPVGCEETSMKGAGRGHLDGWRFVRREEQEKVARSQVD